MSKELKNGIEILVGQQLWIKTSKYYFDQYLKNRLAYLDFNTFLSSFDEQFITRYIIILQKDVDNFEVRRAKNMLIFS